MQSIVAYDLVTRKRLARVPATSWSWSHSINEAGSMSVEAVMSPELKAIQPRRTTRPWEMILALQDGSKVIHAGPVMSRKWDAPGRKLSWECGGGWTLLTKRLVITKAVIDSWRDGEVLIDEDNPPAKWQITVNGSWSDLARGLISASEQIGATGIRLPAVQGGSARTKTWNIWDFATISDRLGDLTELEDGPEIEFAPYISTDGLIGFDLKVGNPEIIAHNNVRWDTAIPGQRVIFSSLDEDGTDITNDVIVQGGKEDDMLLLARSSNLSRIKTPLQSADTSHSTVSDLKTAQSYARADVADGQQLQESYAFSVGEELNPSVGDHVTARVVDDYLDVASGGFDVKITDVSGKSDSDWLDVQARPL